MVPTIHTSSLTAFCERHHIRKLALFGSILTDRFHDGSDVDFLVDFEPGHVPGFIRLAGMERELTNLVGRRVDMRTPEDLSRDFRDQVLSAAVVQYERR